MAAAHSAFASPLLGPDFAQAVGRVRSDARVAVFRQDGRTVGFLPHHPRPGGLARPIGAPLSDYHALVSDGPIDGAEALTAAGLSALRFTGLIDPLGIFSADVRSHQESYVIELGGDPEAYLEALRAASPKKVKNYRRLAHKLERDLGELTIVAPDPSQSAFETLVDWKRTQLRFTGTHDFLQPAWIAALMRDLFERRDGDLQGLAVNLYAGGRLVAGHFGVRLGGVYHPWLASADPQLGAYSPGQMFLTKAIGAMPALGLSTYDLGPGHDHYKRAYALSQVVISEGVATAPGRAGDGHRQIDAVWALAGARRGGLAASLRRRLDTIAAVELTLAGRARGFAQAIADQARKRQGAGGDE